MAVETPRTALFARKQPGGVFTIVGIDDNPGDVYFVDDSGTDQVGSGRSPDDPVATIDYAIGLCTANQGDVIYVLPGHAESVAATDITCDIAGVTIIGLGSGNDRPVITLTATGSTVTVSAASVKFKNIIFLAGVDSITAGFTVSGVDCTLEDVEFRDAVGVEAALWVLTTAAAERLTVRGCFHNGDVAGNAAVATIRAIGVDSLLVEDCRFLGEYTTAVIEFHTTLCTRAVIQRCTFLETGTTDYSKTVVDTVTGSTWAVRDCFDLGAGASFSGGSGGALAGDDVAAVKTDTAAILVDTGTTLPATLITTPAYATKTSTSALTSGSIFTWAGSIEVIHIIGRVTTGIQAQATTIKLQMTPDALAAQDMCATVDGNGFGVGTLLAITGTAANAMTGTTVVGGIAPGQANSVVMTSVTSGTITTVFGAASTGVIVWEVLWRPLNAAGTLAAA